MLAVKRGRVDVVVTLLQAEADPNFIHKESGDTALHIAARLGNVKVIKGL